jgi:short-subunit dehydrogenase
MSEKSLAGRKALVTGGARGIGAAIAEALTNPPAVLQKQAPRLALWN